MRARSIASKALLVLGTLLAVLACLGVWADRQALDTDEWVDTSGRLFESEPIRTAVGLYLVDKLYDTAKVEDRLDEVLPPRLAPLAAPIASGLQDVARKNVPRLLGNAVAVEAWKDANRAAHARLVQVLENDDPEGVDLDLSQLLAQVAADAGLPAKAVDKLPPDLAQLQVLPPEELDTARSIVKALETAGWLLLALALACFAGAVALARDRRRALVGVAGCMLVAGVAVLAVRRLAGGVVVDALADSPNAQPAAADAWSIATSLLVDVAQGLLLVGLLILLGAWLLGPGRRAAWLRGVAAPALGDHPAAARVVLSLLLLGLVWWQPVPWTGRAIPLLLLAVAAFVWLELVRRRAATELRPGAG